MKTHEKVKPSSRDPKLVRAIGVNDILTTKFERLRLSPEWVEFLGEPEPRFSWTVWGQSGSGKSSFLMKLAREFCMNDYRVAYNSGEERWCASIQAAALRAGIADCKYLFKLVPGESLKLFAQRLRQQNSPDVAFIDSIQKFAIKKSEYEAFCDEFKHKVLIWVSHEDEKTKEPRGSVAQYIRYDSFVKIRVEGYKAFSVSRLGGGKPYVIWKKGSDEYWNENI